MKNVLASVTVVLSFSINGFGQNSFIKFQIGYGIPLNTYSLGQSSQISTTSSTYTEVYGSYGSGLRLEAGYIHALSNRLNLEMDFTYLSGKSYNFIYVNNGTAQNQNNSSRFYEVSPLLRVNLGGSKVRPYAAIGPVLGLGTLIANAVVTSSGTTNSSEFQRQYSGSAAIGAKSVVGAELTHGNVIFFAQVTLIAMNYSPSKSEYTKYTLNGVDQLSMLTTRQKETVYENSVTATTGSTPDPTKPAEALKFYFPFNSISLNVGVMFKF